MLKKIKKIKKIIFLIKKNKKLCLLSKRRGLKVETWRHLDDLTSACLVHPERKEFEEDERIVVLCHFHSLTLVISALCLGVDLSVSNSSSQLQFPPWINDKLCSTHKTGGLIPHFIQWMVMVCFKSDKKFSWLHFVSLVISFQLGEDFNKTHLECYALFCFISIPIC